MASSSSSARQFSEQTSGLSCQTEFEMESARLRHWSNLSYSRTSSEWSVITNYKDYDVLKAHPEWGGFFRDFHTLELGRMIGRGAQADVYEARTTMNAPFDLVAKVMMGAPLGAFKAQWPVGMLSAYNSKDSYVLDLPLMTILGGTVLTDPRYRGRFAFVMYRRWGDLRTLIDRRMKLERSIVGPFFMDQAIQLMMRIAEDMYGLHNKYDIMHRDLKASNVLVWGKLGDDENVFPPSQNERIGSVVADFESSEGVLGTGWWRAPEILEQVKRRVPSSDLKFTRESDVYSYGMTCYEIVTGCYPFESGSAFEESHEIVSSSLPFEDVSVSEASQEIVSDCLSSEDQRFHVTIDDILDGRRPNLPTELPSFLRSIIVGCWHHDPKMRPNFYDICKMLKYKHGCNPANIEIDNESNKDATIIKVENWGILQSSTLNLNLERLLEMQLHVSKAKVSHIHTMQGIVVQCFEVTDGDGRKVCDENIVANIVKVLSSPMKVEWIAERLEDADNTLGMYLLHIMLDTEGLSETEGTSGTRPLETRHSLIRMISGIMFSKNIQAHNLRSTSHGGDFEVALFVEAGNMHNMHHMVMNILDKGMTIVLRKLASQYVDWDFPDGKLHALRAPRNPPAIRICVEEFGDYRFDDFYTEFTIICLERSGLLIDVACSLLDSNHYASAIIEEFEVPSYIGIKVPRSFMVEDVSFKGREKISRFKDFVRKHFKLNWNIHRNVVHHDDIEKAIKLREYVDWNHNNGGELELICKFRRIDDIIQHLHKNGFFVSTWSATSTTMTPYLSRHEIDYQQRVWKDLESMGMWAMSNPTNKMRKTRFAKARGLMILLSISDTMDSVNSNPYSTCAITICVRA